ncbi:MAG TPA: polyphenol oxidase family protein [Acidimicrobiales bacterium]|nr:polyphenol oxidase family protein [Acidimicrobiales bacterium]
MSSEVVLGIETRDALTVHPIGGARALGVDAFVTDRFGGVSSAPYDSLNLGEHVGDRAKDVRENRRRVASAIGVDASHLVIVRQVHGADVLDASNASPSSEADALVSDGHDLGVAILVADCVPILLVDSSSNRFAIVHAGWRGLHVGVIAQTLLRFRDAAQVRAFFGPSISGEGYQVGPEVAVHFAHLSGAVTPDVDDRSRLDLSLVATRQLLERGVPDTSIVRCRQVTDGGEVFFSDRAQRPCGRFAFVARRIS